MQRLAFLLISSSLVAGCGMMKMESKPPAPPAKPVVPLIETEQVQSSRDAADDPAIWIHPTDPTKSLIIGTDKKQGLEVYDLTGKRVQSLPDGRMNNVDLRYGFKLGKNTVAIVAATNRTNQSLALYAMGADGVLKSVGDNVATGMEDPYGLCMYRNTAGQFYVFANDGDSGDFKQWRLDSRDGRVVAEKVREFSVGSQAEGCAADDGTGHLYVAEEDVGLWRYSAEPNGGSERMSIDTVARGYLTDDVEGVAIYYGAGKSGYIIVSSQGSNDYNVYRREGDNAFVGKFAIVDADNGVDGTSDTDGIEVTSVPLGSQFQYGLFVAQDGSNTKPNAYQNFKLVPWERIARALRLPL